MSDFPHERLDVHRVAIRSGTECFAILDACRILKLTDEAC